MEQILDALNNPIVLTAVLLVLLVTALAVLMRLFSERERGVGTRLDEAERRLTERFEGVRTQSGEQAARSREELSSNLRGMSDSVTRVMGEMARTQQTQLDAFAARLSDMARVDEQRMDEMRKTVEGRLMAYEDRMDRIGGIIDGKLDKNEQRMEQMRQTIDQRMASLQADNNARLQQMQKSVDEQLNTTLDRRLDESFRLVSERLDQVYRGLGEMQTLASGVGDLKKVLTGVNTRGLVGEIQLGTLLSQILARDQYTENAVIMPGGGCARYAVRLPGIDGQGESLLPIDAQFPQEAYERLIDAVESGDAVEVDRRELQLEQKLIDAAARIGEQLVSPPFTTDFAVLFLGSEGLYAEALRRTGLTERLRNEYHVTLAGPATLSALLNSLQMGFRTLAIERRSEEVWALLGAVRGEFVDFAEALARTQKRIRQASESIEDAANKSRTIQKKLKGVEELNVDQRRALLKDAETSEYEDWD